MSLSFCSRTAAGFLNVTAALWMSLGISTATAGEVKAYRLSADYKITLNSFEIGTLHFKSSVGANTYSAESKVELSALFGAVSWNGTIRSSGTFRAAREMPGAYAFDFVGSAGAGAVSMVFNQTGVSSLTVRPGRALYPDTVPLKSSHLKDVLDPLSAAIALTRSDASTPCGRKVKIFDGLQRFDLELYFRHQESVGNSRAIVCRAKYVPIAGYRNNSETRALSRSTGIEIVFRPTSVTDITLPDEITVPTFSGPVVLKAQRAEIAPSGQREVALVSGLAY
jgi:hypothetical protein